MQTCYLSFETTGLNPADDEIVEIAILDNQGAAQVDTLIRPACLTE